MTRQPQRLLHYSDGVHVTCPQLPRPVKVQGGRAMSLCGQHGWVQPVHVVLVHVAAAPTSLGACRRCNARAPRGTDGDWVCRGCLAAVDAAWAAQLEREMRVPAPWVGRPDPGWGDPVLMAPVVVQDGLQERTLRALGGEL